MKGQDTILEKQLNAVEIGNLPLKEFRIMMVRLIQDLRERMEAKTENIQEKFTIYQRPRITKEQTNRDE